MISFHKRWFAVLTSLLTRIPIKISMPVVLTLPVLGVVTVLSLLAFVNGRQSMNNLMEQNLYQIHGQITHQIAELLKTPQRLDLLNAHLIRQGKLDPNDLRSWRTTFFEQMRAFRNLGAVTWGDPQGRAVWIVRNAGDSGYIFAIKDRQTGDEIHEYALNSQGELHGEPTADYVFDPRIRPWYTAAMQAGGPTWSDVYTWVGGAGLEPTIGMGFAQPVSDANGNLLGVIDTELSLVNISHFLGTLKVGDSGRSFVLDRMGHIIASSMGTPVTDTKGHMLAAWDSYSPHVAALGRHLKNDAVAIQDINIAYQTRLDVDGAMQLTMVSPFHLQNGRSWLIATMIPVSDFMVHIRADRRRNLIIGLVAVVFTVMMGLVLAYIGTHALLDLVRSVHRIAKGDLDHELKLKYSPEFVKLSNEINKMLTGLRDRMRLRHSLALAMEVQQSLLPSSPPEIEGLDMAIHSTYCDETGGDYYDFLDISGLSASTAAIALGDVMGHGVAAAMLMATARGILRCRCQEPGSLADLLTNMNRLLVKDTEGKRFMTMLLMTIDGKAGRLRYATAGHEPPLLFDIEKNAFVKLEGQGLPLGIMEGASYEQYQYSAVKTGQVYVISTDGVWEAMNAKEEFFGMERFCDLIRECAHLSAQEISDHIIQAVNDFRGGSKQKDDIAFVVIKVL